MKSLLLHGLPQLARLLGKPLQESALLAPADAIVVLGSPPRPDGRPTLVLGERVAAACELFARGVAPLVCVTGGGLAGRNEADAMAAAARARGIPDAALLLERRATNTLENARLCAPLLRARGVRSLWVVTQPFHTRRAAYCFRRQGFEVRAWHIEGLQQRSPRSAMRWQLREYAAWLVLGVRIVLAG